MRETQMNIVLNHLRNNPEGITSMEAFRKYSITRLSATIFNLRKEGYNIQSKLETKKVRGKSSTFSRYTLI